jgi:prevent-host-death family protein
MDEVGAYEAKTHLPRLLDEVAGGRTITITKHGRPVARLVPVRSQKDDPRATIDAIRAARRGTTLGKDTIRDLIEEGRRH